MKRYFITLIIIIIAGSKIVAQSSIHGTQSIDVMDTVSFDLSKAIITGNTVSFPVSITSDDTIYALDFSLKYNHANIMFDTIADLTNYLQQFSFYNTNDSTVRFTSYSLIPISKDTDLVLVEFTLLAPQLADTDLNTIKAFLNGTACSIKLNSVSTALTDLNNPEDHIGIYPNPASADVQIAFDLLKEGTAVVELYELNGKRVATLLDKKVYKDTCSFNTSVFNSGIYLVKTLVDNQKFENRMLQIIH